MVFGREKFDRTYESLEGISPKDFISFIEPKTKQANSLEGVEESLAEGGPLRVKFGTDPTGPDLHFGHVVPVRILDLFSRAGHDIDLVFGDFTAKVGDPSHRSSDRPVLSDEEIANNVSTFSNQISPFLDVNRDNVHISYNSEWLKDMPFSEIFEYLQEVNLSEAMQRRDFRQRMLGRGAISLAEVFYGTMTGIDSVNLRTDVEIGGIDQLLNFEQAREVQRRRGQKPEDIIMTPILEGTSGGGIKMSKSYGNYIPLRASASEVYGKMMSIPDELIEPYIHAFMPVHTTELDSIHEATSSNPLEMKKQLATYMAAIAVGNFDSGLNERENFDRRFSKKIIEEEDITYLPFDTESLIDALMSTGRYKSRNDIKRLARQGAIKKDGEKLEEEELYFPSTEEGALITVGKKDAFRVSPREHKP